MCTDHYTRIIIIADAWTQRLFNDCLEDGKLPEIRHYLCSRGTFYPEVVSNFPSVSLSSHTTLLTGVNQNIHEIPGHRWVFLKTKKVRNYIGPSFLRVNDDISTRSQTVFEKYSHIPTYSIQSIITRGASHRVLLPALNSEQILESSADLIVKNPEGMFVIWLPNGDIVSHKKGPRSRAMAEEMMLTSRGIGKLCAKLETHRMLKSTKILFTSDHGQREVKQRFSLEKALKSLGFDAEVNSMYRVSKDVSVFTNGDSSASIYFDEAKFSQDFKFEILDKLASFKEIDLVFFKYSQSLHYIFSREGIARINSIDDIKVDYEIVKGNDPLGLIVGETKSRRIDDYRNPIDGKYPDIIHQYLTSITKDRSIDVVVTASGQYHFSIAPRIGWRLGFHHGSHGGATREEMMFSAILTDNTSSKKHTGIVRSRDLISYL